MDEQNLLRLDALGHFDRLLECVERGSGLVVSRVLEAMLQTGLEYARLDNKEVGTLDLGVIIGEWLEVTGGIHDLASILLEYVYESCLLTTIHRNGIDDHGLYPDTVLKRQEADEPSLHVEIHHGAVLRLDIAQPLEQLPGDQEAGLFLGVSLPGAEVQCDLLYHPEPFHVVGIEMCKREVVDVADATAVE